MPNPQAKLGQQQTFWPRVGLGGRAQRAQPRPPSPAAAGAELAVWPGPRRAP